MKSAIVALSVFMSLFAITPLAASEGDLDTVLTNPGGGNDESTSFGSAVASDEMIVFVGAPNDSLGSERSGAVYMFDITIPAHVYTFYSPRPENGEEFGASIAVKKNKLFVGAPGNDNGEGAVYVFNWRTGVLLDVMDQFGGGFGESLAVAQDKLGVGAPGSSVQGFARAGQFYVFDIDDREFRYTISNPEPGMDDEFPGTLIGKGRRFYAGTWLDNSSAENEGAVSVFDARNSAYIGTIRNLTSEPGDLFGRGIAVQGKRLYVSEPQTSPTAPASGFVHIIDLDSRMEIGLITSPYSDPLMRSEQFGVSLAARKHRLLVGAPHDLPVDERSGVAYLYDEFGTLLRVLTPPTDDPGDRYGSTVHITSEKKMLISAPDARTSNGSRGAVYVYDGDEP